VSYEADERAILGLANHLGKFAVPLNAELSPGQTAALFRLIARGTIKLTDTVPLPQIGPGLYRVYIIDQGRRRL
jgi:hypothetical protein